MFDPSTRVLDGPGVDVEREVFALTEKTQDSAGFWVPRNLPGALPCGVSLCRTVGWGWGTRFVCEII